MDDNLGVTGSNIAGLAEVLDGALVQLLDHDPITFAAGAHLAAGGLPDPTVLTVPVTRFLDTADTEALIGLRNGLLGFHLRLGTLAIDVLQQLLRRLPHSAGGAEDPRTLSIRAAILHDLGVRLAEVGRREQALAAAEEATSVYRQLAEANPEAYLPDLATALANLGNRLAEVGHGEQALAPTEEALAIRRRLAEANPEAGLPDLAMSLHNLGIRLAEVGRRVQALAPTEEALAIRRRLAEANPDAGLPHLADTLAVYGMILEALGQYDEALSAIREAVAIFGRVLEAFPEVFSSRFITSAQILTRLLREMGKEQEAEQIERQLGLIE